MFSRLDSPRVLAIGAHPDDIEFGAGGFIYRLIAEKKADVTYLIMTLGLKGIRNPNRYNPESRREEAEEAAKVLGVKNVIVKNHADCGLHLEGHDLIQEIEECMRLGETGSSRPPYDIVLTHSGEDAHADHREVHEATVSGLRSSWPTMLLYQSPSTKPNGFRPTFFVKLNEQTLARKLQALLAHESQRSRKYMTTASIKAMASTWSFFHRAPNEHFEAFEVYKTRWADE